MSEVKLPFDLNPLLNTYLYLAHPLGIISGNIPDQSVWFPWMVQKYINCDYHNNAVPIFTVYSADRFFIGDDVIKQMEIKLNSPICQKLGLSEAVFIGCIKQAIVSGLYVHGQFNERYVSAMPAYQKKDYAHDYLIFGYSDNQKCFYTAGYTSDGHYKQYELPFKEYYCSIFQPHFKALSLRFMMFNEEKPYETNYSVVVRDLKHYLSSTAYKGETTPSTLYGLAVWYKLSEYISTAEKIDLRFTKIFMEHHKLMYMRLDYFSKEGIIPNNLSEQYLQAKSYADQVYLLSMKYNLTQRQREKNSCIQLIEKSIELDRTILPDVIDQIEKNINAE